MVLLLLLLRIVAAFFCVNFNFFRQRPTRGRKNTSNFSFFLLSFNVVAVFAGLEQFKLLVHGLCVCRYFVLVLYRGSTTTAAAAMMAIHSSIVRDK